MAEHATGSRVGHYQLGDPIGHGGFATVYHAVDELLDCVVAVKILAENWSHEPDIRERFVSEAQLLRRAASRAVIAVHGVGETERGQPYIVLAYADRGDLTGRVASHRAQGRPIVSDDIYRVADTLTMALSRLHAAGVVHRDVKPDNLLIASDGADLDAHLVAATSLLGSDDRLMLGDLGIAKDLAASSGVTVGAGTNGFSAPEQRVGLGEVDHRADIYGASAVLFWMATQTTPPQTEEELDPALEHAGLSESLTAALRRGLADRPADRFDSIEQWRQAIVADLATPTNSPPGDSSASTVMAANSSPAATPTSQRTPPGLIILAICLAALIAAAGTWFAFSETGPFFGPANTAMPDGRVRIQDSRGDLVAAVFGEPTATVGQSATFEASVSNGASLRWFTSDGTVLDQPVITVPVDEAGQHVVTLIASDPDGRTVTIEFPFETTE